MRKVELADLVDGMCIGNDVISESGVLVIPQNVEVTPNIRKRLELFQIDSVYVDEDCYLSLDIKQTEIFKEFNEEYDVVVDSMQNSYNDIIQRNTEDSKVFDIVNRGYQFYKESNEKRNVLDMLHAMREYSDSTFLHSLNVAMIAAMIGRWLNWSEEDVEKLFTAGMFHDIGKLQIPQEIIDKPGKLTDEEYAVIKTHPVKGLEILQRFDLEEDILKGVSQHHERFDGSGYPYGLAGKNINRFARVIAISDVYDAMTATRVYRGPVCPFDVISIFESEGLRFYDTEYVLTFINNVMESYMHSRVKLSNGQIAEVMMINKTMRSKPLVMADNGKFIDLSRNKDITISGILG